MTLKASLVVITNLLIQLCVLSLEFIPNYMVQFPRYTIPVSLTPLSAQRQNVPKLCYINKMWNVCANNYYISSINIPQLNLGLQNARRSFESTFKNHIQPASKTDLLRNEIIPSTEQKMQQRLANDIAGYLGHPIKEVNERMNGVLQNNHNTKGLYNDQHSINIKPAFRHQNITFNKMDNKTVHVSNTSNLTHTRIGNSSRRLYIIKKFIHALDHLERTFYATTYATLSSISPPERQENGISFLLSSLFLQIALIALSTEVDLDTRREIDKCTGFTVSDQEKEETLKNVLSWLPMSDSDLKFRYATRLVLQKGVQVSRKFLEGAALALRMNISYINMNDTAQDLTQKLNHMVELDSGGSMRDTFEDEELSEGICGVLLSTVYVRARWRAPPTLLNGTAPFRDTDTAPARNTHMIRINDVMRYIDLHEWDAEALEISYATPGLTFLLVVPRGRSLRNVAAHMSVTSVKSISDRMKTLRIAATLPLYTLRMTLLLPAKLQAMGINRLINANNTCDSLWLSHGVQRIMFWAEAGRYAYKDDGIEWDETPELRIIVDRPYLFYVRWHNITILNGNFVL